MFKGVYNITLNQGIKSDFHKKYYIHDGLGIVSFATKKECNSYIAQKSEQLKQLFEYSKFVLDCVFRKHLESTYNFRQRETEHSVTSDLIHLLQNYSKISSSFQARYILSTLRTSVSLLLKLSKQLHIRFVIARLVSLSDIFFTDYPVFGRDIPKKQHVKLNNYEKKCII